jgi:uroporphyrinogen decarboxylase
VAESLFLQAFKGTNKRVPVWFMRQAGRYLPRYRAIKEKYSLGDMFRNPELASEITCLPVDILGVDAAILFADILTLPSHMGFHIRFDDPNGPRLDNLIDKEGSLKNVRDFEGPSYIAETIRLSRERLPKDIPLIGFAGSPFTVLTYLIEGRSSVNLTRSLRFVCGPNDAFHQWMNLLTDNTIRYLHLQKEAGIQVFQLFDTWAGILRPADYARGVLPYVRRIFKAVDLPAIYFVRNCAHLLALMDQCEADFLSVDHTVVLGHPRVIEMTRKGIQGNLFNGLLYADYPALQKEVNDVLIGGQKHGRHIFNLSHGVFPDTDPDKLKFIVDQVHAFDGKN